jgi:hypothetical protein
VIAGGNGAGKLRHDRVYNARVCSSVC